MKKLIALVLCLACLTACFTGCSKEPSSSGGGNSAGSSGDSSKQYDIVLVSGDIADAWQVRMEEGMAQFQKDTGHNAYMKGPTKSDSSLQAQVLEDVIAHDIDALIVCPVDAKVIDPILKKARDKGIIVISTEGSELENVDYDVEPDSPAGIGEKMMEVMAEEMGGKGKYTTMVAYLTYPSHNAWADSAIAYQKANYPDMECIDPPKLECEDNVEVAYERTKEILKSNPDLNAILGVTCFSGPGIAKAVEELGLAGKVTIGGTCVASLNEPYFESGTIKQETFWDPLKSTYACCALAVKLLENPDLEVKDGLDLGIEGYTNMKVEQTESNILLKGDAMQIMNKDNYKDYPW